jgi:bacteriorhodopsin
MFHFDIYQSLVLSLLIQLIIGFIGITTLFLKIPIQFLFFKQMILLELFVSFIEGSFYIYWLFNFKKIINITPQRYIDWFFSTPAMLINLIFYLIYLDYKQKNKSEKLHFFELFKKEFNTIITVLLLNWFMLFFGYLAEICVIPNLISVFLGIIPFLLYYFIIYKKYGTLTADGLKIYFYFLFFWSLYGVVACFPYKVKNICYNILDLFSKNFFGLFLSYLIITSQY